MGTIVLSVMVSRFSTCSTLVYSRPKVSLGEMIAYLPIPGGHIKLSERFVNPALSFAMGWNYWYNWVIVGIFNLRLLLFSPSDVYPQLLVHNLRCYLMMGPHNTCSSRVIRCGPLD